MDLPQSAARLLHLATASLFALLTPLSVHAQTIPAPIQHIEVMDVSPWADTNRQFSTRNFIVTQQGHRYPIQLTQPTLKNRSASLPTHLLVVMNKSSAKSQGISANPDTLLPSLTTVLAHGWQVSIMRFDGYATPYLTTISDLKSSLAAPLESSPPPDSTLTELRSFPGRRVLLLVGPIDQTDDQWLASQKPFFSPIYVVDGGIEVDEPVQFPTPSGNTYTSDTLPPYKINVRRYIAGIAHEKNLSTALHDALLDTHNFYDLAFTPIASPVSSTAPVILTLRHLPPHELFSVDTYVIAPSDPNSPPIAIRTHDNLVVITR
jgi:hypothetical protein